jgi:hypothetical protein
VLTEVLADAWVAANGTADHGHTISSGNPLGSVTSIGTASVMHSESRSSWTRRDTAAAED